MAESRNSGPRLPRRSYREPQRNPLDESTLKLLNRAQEGDSAALEWLCTRYLPRLYRWATGRLPIRSRRAVDTDDLVQDTLLKAIRRLGHIQPRHAGDFPAYLRTAILNRLRDEIRKTARRAESAPLDGTEVDPLPSPVEEVIGQELTDRYEEAFTRLSDGHRAALFLRIELGMNHEEVADALDKPNVDAARKVIYRGLIRLAKEMSVEN